MFIIQLKYFDGLANTNAIANIYVSSFILISPIIYAS